MISVVIFSLQNCKNIKSYHITTSRVVVSHLASKNQIPLPLWLALFLRIYGNIESFKGIKGSIATAKSVGTLRGHHTNALFSGKRLVPCILFKFVTLKFVKDFVLIPARPLSITYSRPSQTLLLACGHSSFFIVMMLKFCRAFLS